MYDFFDKTINFYEKRGMDFKDFHIFDCTALTEAIYVMAKEDCTNNAGQEWHWADVVPPSNPFGIITDNLKCLVHIQHGNDRKWVLHGAFLYDDPQNFYFRVRANSEGQSKFFADRFARALIKELGGHWCEIVHLPPLYAIEAMQSKGFCSQIEKPISRTVMRRRKRKKLPEYKMIEVKLGKKIQTSKGSGFVGEGGIVYHYRRGHKVNHPNPNYPKWRRGCWVGDPTQGVNWHTYTAGSESQNETQ